MTATIYIGAISRFTGRHFVTIGLAKNLQERGIKVGYFKPYSINTIRKSGKLIDEDASFFKQLLGLQEHIQAICPLSVSESQIWQTRKLNISDRTRLILSSLNRINKGKDVILIGQVLGVCSGCCAGISERKFIKQSRANVIVVAKTDEPLETVDKLLCLQSCLEGRLVGVIFNKVPLQHINHMANRLKTFLEKYGIHVYGFVPHDPMLGSVQVSDIIETLRGHVIIGTERLNQYVERFMIGAMSVANALKYFRRYPNKAVITGGDRADIQLAALETSTRCLILTGNLEPCAPVIAKADEVGVPIIVVPFDTATTIEKCEALIDRQSLRSNAKLDRVTELFEKYVDINRLCKDCGIALKSRVK